MKKMRPVLFIFLFLFFCSSYDTKGQYSHAKDSLHELLVNAKSDTSKAIALLEYGGQYSYKLPDTALYYYSLALAIIKKTNFYRGYQKYIMYQTEVYDNEGKFDSSIVLCRLGLEMATQQHDDYFTAINLTNTGDIFLAQSNHDSAADYYLQAAPVFEKIKDSLDLGITLSDLAIVFSQTGQFRRAIDYDKQALNIAQKTNDELGIGYTCSNIGSDYLKLNIYDTSKIYSLQALAIARNNEDNSLEINVLVNLGLIEDNAANYNKALEYYTSALKMSRNLKSDQDMVSSYNAIASTLFKMKQYDSSLHILQRSLPVAITGNFREQTKDIYLLQYKNYKALHKNDLALDAYVKYSDIKDSVSNTEVQKNISLLEQQYQAASKQKQILQRDLEIQQQNILLRNKNTWIYILIGIVILIVALGYMLYKYQQQKQASALNEQKINELKTSIKAKEEERSRIAAELHDEVGSTLSGISLYSSLALQQLENSNIGQSKNSVSKISTNVQDTLSKLSDIVWELRPHIETIDSIQQKIKRYLSEITKPDNISMHFDYHNPQHSELPDTESAKHIYLIAKEAIHNAVKYAKCKNIFVAIQLDTLYLKLRVKDNGTGFDTSLQADGNGLRNMKKRADDMNASLEIESNENGTTVMLYKKLTQLG